MLVTCRHSVYDFRQVRVSSVTWKEQVQQVGSSACLPLAQQQEYPALQNHNKTEFKWTLRDHPAQLLAQHCAITSLYVVFSNGLIN